MFTNLRYSNNLTKVFVLTLLSLLVAMSQPTSYAGELVGWGYNYAGVTDVPEGDDFVAISAAAYHNLALRADGTVVAWGADYYGEGVVPDGLTDVVAIAAGTYHNLAVRADGTVVAWGRNQYGETTVPDGLSDVVAVAAKDGWGSLALKADGSMVAWGGYTMTPTGNDFVAITAGGYVMLGLRADGSLEDTYPYYVTPEGESLSILHPEGNDFVAIAAAYSHVLAAKADGTVVAWGVNTYGETVVPDGLSDVVAVAAGGSGPWGGGHSLALKADGTVVGWGYNVDGQTVVPARNDFVGIAAGTFHSLAIIDTSVEAKLENLINDVEAINFENGISNSLIKKLDNALAACLAENADQRQDAINKMEAFINSVEAQQGKKISDADADYLVAAAEAIILQLLEI